MQTTFPRKAAMRYWFVANVLVHSCFGATVFKEDFEYRSDYGYVQPGLNALYPEGKFTIDRNPNASHSAFASFGDHGTGVGRMLIVNGVSNSAVWQRKIRGAVPGQQYVIRLWAASAYSQNPASLQFTVNGVATGPVLNLPSSTGLWRSLSTTVAAASSTLTVRIVNLTAAAGGNDFAIDDFEVVSVSTQAALLDEDFEVTTQYRFVNPGYNALYDEGTATVDNNPSYSHQYFTYFPDHTGDNGNMFIANGVANSTVWGRRMENLIPGQSYTLKFYAKATYPVNPAQLAVRVQGVQTGQLTLPGNGSTGDWVQILANFTATAANQQVDIVDTVSTPGGNDFAIDDIDLQSGLPADTVPPAISGLTVTSRSSTEVTVTWNTNEYATTLVEFGVGVACTGVGSVVDSSFVLSPHQAVITGLTPNTTYCFKATSRDQSQNSSSQTITFQTPPNAAAGCVVDVEVLKRTRRVNGNRVVGSVIAFAKSGAWQYWMARVSGEMYYTDPSATTSTKLSEGSSPLKLLAPIAAGNPNDLDKYNPDPANPTWSHVVDLQPRGSSAPGFYWVKGTGTFAGTGPCLGQAGRTIPWIDGPWRQVERPSAPTYKPESTSTLFYLGKTGSGGSILSSGQYRASTVLKTGNPNFEETGLPFRQWIVEQPSASPYIGPYSCEASRCFEIKITALRPSEDCGIPTVKIYNDYDGFRSEPLEVFINRPFDTAPTAAPSPPAVQTNATTDEGHGQGYSTRVRFHVRDRCNVRMRDFSINWRFAQNPSHLEANSNWVAGEPAGYTVDLDNDGNPVDFVEHKIEGKPGPYCGQDGNETCAPIPVYNSPPQTTQAVMIIEQTWRVGSGLTGQGVVVQKNNQESFLDQGKHGGVVTPVVPFE